MNSNRNTSLLAWILSAAILPCAVPAATFTWDGGDIDDDLFGSGDNWIGDVAPGVGSDVVLEFTGGTRTTPSNNYTTGDNFGQWWLLASATADFTITGNGFGLFDKIENQAGSGRLFSVNTAGIYARDGSIEINPVGGEIAVGAAIELDGNASLNVWDGGNGRTLTINGSLSNGNGTGGNGSLVLNETSTVVLAGSNDYGTTTVNTGTTLRVGAGSTSGTLGTGDVTNNGSLVFHRSDALAVSNAISGTGSVTQNGGGTLTFGNQKTYTGGTTVNAGVLDLTGGGGAAGTIRGSVTVNSGTVLRLSASDVTGYGTGSDRLSTINLVGGTMNVNTTGNQTLGNATINMTGGSITGIAGSNIDFFQGSSALNTYASATASTISGVSLSPMRQGSTTFNVENGAAAIDLDISSVIRTSLSGDAAGGIFTKAGAGTMRATGEISIAREVRVNGGSMIVSNTMRNVPLWTVNNGSTLELGATNMIVENHGAAVAATRVLTINGSTLLMNGSMDSRIGNVTLNNGSTWTSNRGLGAWDVLLANVSTGPATVSVTGTGASTMNGTGGIHLQGAQNFSVANTTGDSAADLVVSMQLDNAGSAGGTGAVNKTGAGTMSITRAATYTGGTTVNEGTLNLGVGGATGTVRGTLTVNSGASVTYTTDNAFGYTAGNSVNVLHIVGGSVGNASGTTYGNHFWNSFQLNMTGGTLYLGGTLNEFHSPTVTVLDSASTATIQRTAGNTSAVIRLRDNTSAIFNVANGAQATDLLVTAPITQSGTSGVTKTGAGTMLLSAASSFTGGLVVNGGVFAVDGSQVNDRLANNSTVTVNNAGSTFEIRGVNALPNHNSSVDVIVNTGGILRLVTGGSTAIGAGGTSHAHVRNVTLAGGTIDMTYSGGGIAYDGESVQINGNLTVNGSAMSVIQSSTTAANSGLALNGNRTFTVNEVVAGTDLLVSAELENTDTSPADDGFTKEGLGSMVLSATNSYSGPTAVNAGSLLVNGANQGTGAFTVGAAGTLGGTGSIAGTVNVSGILSPGASIESLATGTLSLLDGSTLVFEAGPSEPNLADLLSITGGFNLTGSVTLDLGSANLADAGWLPDTKLAIASYTGLWNGGLFSGWSNGGSQTFGSNVWTIDYDDPAAGLNFAGEQAGTRVTLTLVPEPSIGILAGMAALGLAVRRRR